jgi:glycosyltransferase involved in cell wall biosynthesis
MPFGGGAQTRAFRHAAYLNRQAGFQARLIALDESKKGAGIEQLPAWATPLRLIFSGSRKAPGWLRTILLVLHIGEAALRLGGYFLRHHRQFDLVHSFGAARWFNLLAMPLARVFGKPAVIEMTGRGHDPFSLSRAEKPHKKQLFPHRPLKYSLFLLADGCVSKSPALSKAYLQAGLPPARLYEIASAVDLEIFRPAKTAAEKEALRQKLGLPAGAAILLYAGRINHEKGLHWLLPAYRDLLKTCSNTLLVLLGPVHANDEAYAQSLKEDLKAWGIAERVRFAGAVNNVPDYMRACDLFVLSSREEGFSSAILEAMASQLPVVVSDVPGISESQVQNGVEGLLVPLGDIQALTEAMETLFTNPQKVKRMGEAARQRVEEMYTPQKIFAAYSQMYLTLMSRER